MLLAILAEHSSPNCRSGYKRFRILAISRDNFLRRPEGFFAATVRVSLALLDIVSCRWRARWFDAMADFLRWIALCVLRDCGDDAIAER